MTNDDANKVFELPARYLVFNVFGACFRDKHYLLVGLAANFDPT